MMGPGDGGYLRGLDIGWFGCRRWGRCDGGKGWKFESSVDLRLRDLG